MITEPKAKLPELAYEIARWRSSLPYSDCITLAENAIAALLAGVPQTPIIHHPLTHWIANTFIVSWPLATAAVDVALGAVAPPVPVPLPDLLTATAVTPAI
jgi:hypothetical protein